MICCLYYNTRRHNPGKHSQCRTLCGLVYTCVGDIIGRLHELQSLKVDETKDKEKQKSEAKSIVHRRRKALTDLFKALELIGLLTGSFFCEDKESFLLFYLKGRNLLCKM